MILLTNTLSAIVALVSVVLSVYFWIVIASAVISWFRVDPYHPVVNAIRRLTEPVFYRVRKWLPFTYSSGLDFSPIAVLLAMQLFEKIILDSLRQYLAMM